LRVFARGYSRFPNPTKQAKVTVPCYAVHQGAVKDFQGPSTEVTTSREELLQVYQTMYAIRRLETIADKMYKQRMIQGFLHLYNGQEAVVTGLEYGITPEDHIITAYRDHGFAYTRGDSMLSILAELVGKYAGTSKGKGGSMHMYSKEGRFYGGNGIVGAQCPIGTGIAFAQKYLNSNQVTLTCYGDGSANQGQLFEAYNMAALWKLPVIYVCENNKYGMGTSVARASANVDFYKRGDVIPGLRVDGNNYLAVRNATEFARNYSLQNGPIVLEMATYRFVGHSMSDPGITYRTRDEVEESKTRDPLIQIAKLIYEHNFAVEAELKEIENKIKTDLDKDYAALEELPFPEIVETYTHVYTEDVSVRGVELSKSYRAPKDDVFIL